MRYIKNKKIYKGAKQSQTMCSSLSRHNYSHQLPGVLAASGFLKLSSPRYFVLVSSNLITQFFPLAFKLSSSRCSSVRIPSSQYSTITLYRRPLDCPSVGHDRNRILPLSPLSLAGYCFH